MTAGTKKAYLTDIFSTALLALLLSGTVIAATSPAEITLAVERKIETALRQLKGDAPTSQRTNISVSRVDPRLRLSECPQPLEVSLKARRMLGRVTAKVSCSGNQPWSIYVPAHISVFQQVVVTNTSLGRDTIIQPDQLSLMELDVSRLNHGFYTNPTQLTGKQLKRSVPYNGVLTPNMVIEPLAVKKGDEVLIQASSGILSVRSQGVAMANGRVGQQIKVKNSGSNRIIRARVIKKGLVAVAI